jgi:hypothetical protein
MAERGREDLVVHPAPGALLKAAPRGGLPTEEVLSRLGAIVPGDPLGWGRAEPPPPDPDSFPPEEEAVKYTQSLLSEKDLEEVKVENAERGGPLSIAEVRKFLEGSRFPGQEEPLAIEAGLLMWVDARVNYKVFIAEGSAFTREELWARYPFEELGTQPEVVFMQQEVYVSGKVRIAQDRSKVTPETARGRGGAGGAGGEAGWVPKKRALTKVWVGKEGWAAFKQLTEVLRLQVRFAQGRGVQLGGQLEGPKFAVLEDEGGARARARAAEARAAEAERRAEAAEAKARELERS